MNETIFNQLVEIRLAIKRFNKLSEKTEKKVLEDRKKVAAYLQKQNGKVSFRSTMQSLSIVVEAAKIMAQDAIRHKNEANSYLRLASRLDG